MKHIRHAVIMGALVMSVVFSFGILSTGHAQLLPAEVTNQIKDEYRQFSGIKVEEASSRKLLINTIANIINWALSAVAIIFVCLIVYAGYRFMVAGGDSEVRQGALQTIRSAVIGLAIVFASFIITRFVIGSIINPPSPQPVPGRVTEDLKDLGGEDQSWFD